VTKLGGRIASGGIPASALASDDPMRASAPLATQRTKLAARLGDIARGEDVVLPVLGRVYIELVKHDVSSAIDGEVLHSMAAARLPATAGFSSDLEIERSARILARACRDPEDHSQPFGTVEEWTTRLDDDVIMACFLVYRDVRERLDPLASGVIQEDELAAVTEAFKKKERTSLLSFGVAMLTNWLLSGAAERQMCPIRSSTPTDGSSET